MGRVEPNRQQQPIVDGRRNVVEAAEAADGAVAPVECLGASTHLAELPGRFQDLPHRQFPGQIDAVGGAGRPGAFFGQRIQLFRCSPR